LYTVAVTRSNQRPRDPRQNS